MKQVIVRMSDELAEAVKVTAARQGVSVNALLVTQVEKVVTDSWSYRRAWKRRHRELLVAEGPSQAGTGDAARFVVRGSGLAAALEEERGPR